MSTLTDDQFDQILELTNAILRRTRQTDPAIKPTDFFSEGWLLNFWLELMSQTDQESERISLHDNSTWMTEVGLRSKIPQMNISVGTTWADAVIGQLALREGTNRGLQLKTDATQFVVIEAKLNASLSAGITHIPGYNQAFRSIAAMAVELFQAGCLPQNMQNIGYYVFSPESRKSEHEKLANRDSISAKYDECFSASSDSHGDLTEFTDTYFRPMLERMTIDCISWEELFGELPDENRGSINAFYELALEVYSD